MRAAIYPEHVLPSWRESEDQGLGGVTWQLHAPGERGRRRESPPQHARGVRSPYRRFSRQAELPKQPGTGDRVKLQAKSNSGPPNAPSLLLRRRQSAVPLHDVLWSSSTRPEPPQPHRAPPYRLTVNLSARPAPPLAHQLVLRHELAQPYVPARQPVSRLYGSLEVAVSGSAP